MITYVIIAITCLVSISAFNNPSLFNKALFNPYIINYNKEWYRFFSHAFIHADWAHLAFNMLSLYFMGVTVEYMFISIFGGIRGELNYALLYVGGILFSSIPSFEKHKNDTYYNSVGASGAVSAVIFASVLLAPLAQISLVMLPGLKIPQFIFGILFLGISWYMSKKGKDNIAHDAHFWGAVFGFVITGLMKPRLFLYFKDQILNFF